MNALLYLYKRNLNNRVNKALHKPATYIYIGIIVLYAFILPTSINILMKSMKLDSPDGMAIAITVFSFWSLPANLIAYAKRKGLIFRGSDVHFLFPSPVGPKMVLLYSHVKTLLMTLVMNILLSLAGVFMFHVSWWKMLLFFLFSVVVENLLEGSMMLLLYGSEKITDRGRTYIQMAAYGLIGIFVLMGGYVYIVQGLSTESVMFFLRSEMIQMVPIVGWYIAVVHLLLTGPTVVNIICSSCYLIFMLILLAAALRMKCTGAYYEDANKFADDYEEVLSSRRQGKTDMRLGKKKKFGKAVVAYKGTGGKALFYRQLLEYKKSRFFIFDGMTLGCIIGGVLVAWLYQREGSFGGFQDFVIPGAMAYLILVFSSMSGKWGKEITSPYTFLLPDTAFRKLWYATLMQHIQALINGTLFALPGALVMGMKPLTVVLCILFFMTLNSCKLYILVVVHAYLGDTIGNTGKQLFQLLLQGFAIGFAFLGGVIGIFLGGVDGAYLVMNIMLLGESIGLMALACVCFYRMETTL